MTRHSSRWRYSTEVGDWKLRNVLDDAELLELLALAQRRKVAGYNDAPRIQAEIDRRKQTASARRERELQEKLF